MKARLKKQQHHDVVTGTPVQAKLLDRIRPMDSIYSPQTPQTEDQQNKQTQQGFNFAEMPIFAGGVGSAPRVQPKFFTGDRTGKMNQQGVQAKLEPVQRAEEDEMQAKLEPVQRAEEDEMQAKLEPVQRAEEDEMQAKLEPVQRAEEDEMQAKLEPVQRAEEDEMQAKLEPVQRAEEDEMQAKLEPVQRKEGKPVNLAPTSIGKPMPKTVQLKMEGAFGADFSGVRIHEGPQAKSINAIAYTQGSNIHFQPGKYQPDTESGQELLGHELTHVVQQRSGKVAALQRKGIPLNTDINLETEADVLGAKAARGEQVQVAGATLPIVQRKKETIGGIEYTMDPIVYFLIQNWLERKANKQGKKDLIKYFIYLPQWQKEATFEIICGGVPSNLKDVKKKFQTFMGRGFLGTGAIDWDKFSDAMRKAAAEIPKPEDQDKATKEKKGVLGRGFDLAKDVLGKGFDLGKDVSGYDMAANEHRHSGDRATGAMDTASMAMIGGGQVVKAVAGASAQLVAGTAFNGVDAASGGYKGYKGHTRKNAAREIQHGTANEDMKLLAGTVKRTQGLERTAGAIDFAKGAAAAGIGASVALGALTSAVLLPVSLVGIGIVGIKIGYKFWKKSRNQERFVDKLFKIDNIKDDKQRKDKREKILQSKGFASVEQVYNDFVVRSSQELFQKGVVEKQKDALALIETIGLKVDHDKQMPKPEKIAKAMTP